jgi:hypothetical protein
MVDMLRLISTLSLLACAALAQEPNTVTASVSSTLTAAGGTAVFRVQFLDAAASSTVETAANAVGSTGASAANLASVNVALSQGVVVTQYDFLVRVPASEYAGRRDALIALQRSLQNSTSQALGWEVNYEVTDAEIARVKKEATSGLLERAREDAEALAAAMGKTLGTLSTLVAPAVTRTDLQLQVTLSATYTVQ